MNLLVLGSGGREHALAWRLSLDPQVERVYVYPGNAGMKSTSGVEILSGPAGSAPTFESTLELVKSKKISLVVIGPEKYLFEGWVDQFQKNSVPAFGPSKAASFLEASKIKSKVFMREWKIPTSEFEIALDLGQAVNAIDAHPEWNGYVIKLSGPSLGKGVIVTKTRDEAIQAADHFFKHRPPGIEEGMVIENRVTGPEVSLFYICLEDRYRFIASACDHKRLKDGDEGPNTGGMGAYSPAHWLTPDFLYQTERDFVVPTLLGMNDRGTPFRGTLFLGLMVTPKGPSLLEYNTRFGDPETQTFLPLLQGDFTHLLEAVATGNREQFRASQLSTSKQHALHVVKAAKGYPGMFGEVIESGQRITVQQDRISSSSKLFFAGVREAMTEKNGALETSGGRVLGLTSVADTVDEARKIAYRDLECATFPNEQFRKDIGVK